MRFLSICSGIEAASVAFRPLGWEAVAFAEIEPFPCSLLAHHYPQVPNLGDLTRWREWSPQLLAQADVLCGGTPCQAFSVAGLRGSLGDERGNLTLTFCHLYDEIDHQRHLHGRPPAVCIWENVPGICNTPDNAFGHFLAGLAGEDVPLTPPGGRWTDAGYVRGPRRAVAWRVLDAQYFGLAQRRERVFVVASADPAFDPAAVLFELDGLRRDTPPRRGPGEGTATTLSARTKGGGGLGTDAECDGAVVPERMTNAECGMRNAGVPECGPIAFPERLSGTQCASEQELSPVLQSRNPTAVAFQPGNLARGAGSAPSTEVFPTLKSDHGRGLSDQDPHVAVQESFAFDLRGREGGAMPEGPHATANLRAGSGGSSRSYVAQKAESEKQKAESSEAFAFHENQRGELTVNDTAGSLKVGGGKPGQGYPAVAYTLHGSREGTQAVASATDTAGTIREGTGTAIQNSSTTVALDQPRTENREPGTAWRVRRLTPEECEMLQGFPVGYTLIPPVAPMQSRTKAKPRKGRRKGNDLSDTIDYLVSLGVPPADAQVLAHSPDGPRYKALGNSWAVPVARWIARRIDAHLNNQPRPL